MVTDLYVRISNSNANDLFFASAADSVKIYLSKVPSQYYLSDLCSHGDSAGKKIVFDLSENSYRGPHG